MSLDGARNSFSSTFPDLFLSSASNTFSWYASHSAFDTVPSPSVSILCISAMVRRPLAYPPVANDTRSSAIASGAHNKAATKTTSGCIRRIIWLDTAASFCLEWAVKEIDDCPGFEKQTRIVDSRYLKQTGYQRVLFLTRTSFCEDTHRRDDALPLRQVPARSRGPDR